MMQRYYLLFVGNLVLLGLNVYLLTRDTTPDLAARRRKNREVIRDIEQTWHQRALQGAPLSLNDIIDRPTVPGAAQLPMHQPEGGRSCDCPLTGEEPTQTPIHSHSSIRNYHSWSLTLHTTSVRDTLDESNGTLPKPRVKKNYAEMRKNYVVPRIRTPKSVDCRKVLEGDENEIRRGLAHMEEEVKVPCYEEIYQEWFHDCHAFKQQRGYITVPLTEEEERYPLAFSIAMFRDVEQVERLLRAIYQPQNIYCIHIDTKTSVLIHRTIRSLANCFDNVFIATHLDKIKWGDVSILLPAINCMRDFVKYYKGKFKYYINLTGQEFPLRTNLELVRIAKMFNGSNDIAGSTELMQLAKDRVSHLWTHRWSKTYQQTIFFDTFHPKAPPPGLNLTFYKGELHGFFSQRMVEYIVEHKMALDYLRWCWDSGHPSEHYWNTLNYNRHLKAPGGYAGPMDIANEYAPHPMVRAKHWVGMTYGDRECMGNAVRGICVYGLQDLPWLHKRKELAANKFHLTFQYLGYDCLEERHRNRTSKIGQVAEDFDENFYRNVPTNKYGRKDGLYENVPIYQRGLADFGRLP